MNDMKSLIGKFCKVYVGNLSGKVCGVNDYGKEYAVSDKPIIYSAEIKSIEELKDGTTFINIIDRAGASVRINFKNIIQISVIDGGGNY